MTQGSKEEDYLQGRWQSQKDYYSNQTKLYKFWHQAFLLISTIGALFVPVLLGFSQIPKVLPIVISLIVSSALALDNAFHFGDNWRSFRQTLEALKRERVYFDAGIEPYTNTHTAFQLFVRKNEDLMGKEGTEYFEVRKAVERTVRDNPAS